MNTIVNYLFELNLGLIFFYAVYILLLGKETQFTSKRWFLLVAMMCSVVFPLITISGGQNTLIPTLSNSAMATWLPEIVIVGNGTASAPATTTNYWSWVIPAYLIVAVVLLVLLFIRIGRIVMFFYQAKRYQWQTYTVAESTQVQSIFSFFNYIFIPGKDSIDEAEKEEILQHEAVHIKKGHSVDIVFVHVLQAVCWFNPIIWFYKTSLVQVHEFEADARSVENMDVDRYCGLLAKVALQQNGFVLANHFTNSFTLKRINMMKTVRRKISQWKIATAILMLATYFVVVACQDQIMHEIADSTLTQTEFPEIVKQDIATKYQAQYPGAKFSYIEGDADEIRTKFAANAAVKQILLNTYPIPNRKTVGVLTVDISNLELKDQNDIYSVVEETATPKNGMEKFYQYIGSNLTYPREARQKGIQGRVFIEFVVNQNGSLSDIRPLKGIGGGCDEEAVKVMANAEAWNPGKQRGMAVRQRMVIPIIFSLDNTAQPAGKLEEVKQSMRTNGKLIQEDGKYFMVGRVTDEEDQPLLGMNIVLAGSTQGTVSNKNGEYKLEVTKDSGMLVFSFVGFKTETISF
ncbi:MAG TPA: TonB family protein [Cyclobacteriaceae bacterium]|nr:TonB family protein [Cyclobacteriaceae bacterium]